VFDILSFLNEMEGRLSKIHDARMRRVKFAELLVRLPNEDVCDIIESIYLDAIMHRAPGRLLLENLAYLDELHAIAGRKHLSDWYTFSQDNGYRFVGEILSPPGGILPEISPQGHKDLSDLTLGEKKSLARKPDHIMIEKVMYEPNSNIITILLNNGRLLLKHVLFIATRRPNFPEILEVIFRHPKWSTNYEVRKALVANPYTMPSIAIVLVPSLNSQDLEFLEYGDNLAASLVQSVLSMRRELEGSAPKKQKSQKDYDELGGVAGEMLEDLLSENDYGIDPDDLDKIENLN